jgi:hypothetical protein
MSGTKLVYGLLLIGMIGSTACGAGFTWKDTEGKYLDMLYDGQRVSRYMYDHDESSEQRIFETYKVLHHVFDETGQTLLTNGPDGVTPYTKGIKYPHHRGIYIGWNKLKFEGQSYDTWHMTKGVRQIHQAFLEKKAGIDSASSKSSIHWITGEGKVMVAEERTVTVHRPNKSRITLVEFETKLKAANGEVILNGDPEHAGFQYRPHNDVASAPSEARAKYLFHKEGIDPKKDKNLPWVAMTHGLNGKQYSVLYMSHPTNPTDEAVYSAYRDYGRFGEFFTHTIPAGETLTLKYQIWIAQGPLPKRDALNNLYKAFAGEPEIKTTPRRR